MQARQRRDLGREKAAEANRLFRMACGLQAEGEIERAVALYEKALRLHPTPDVMAYLGWVKSTRGDTEAAIALCQQAIRLDPEFANGWNDIGAYLVVLDRPEEALFYLKRALRLRRRSARCFPHYNLHRAYLALGERSRAIAHLEAAMEADPDFEPAAEALSALQAPPPAESMAAGDVRDAEAATDPCSRPHLLGSPVLASPPR